MQEIKKGDAVTRNSYGNDIIFIVKRILKLTDKRQIAILKGINVRVEADAPIEDLKLVGKDEIKRCEGTQFDPQLAEVFLQILENDFNKIIEIQEKYAK